MTKTKVIGEVVTPIHVSARRFAPKPLGFSVATSASRTREKVRSIIVSRPLITRSEICRMTGFAWGTVWLHVNELVKTGEITIRTSPRKSYLLSKHDSPSNPEQLRLLRLEIPTKILAFLQARPCCGLQAVAENLGLSRKVVSRHLAALVKAGLISRTSDFRARFEVVAPWLSFHRGPMPAGVRAGPEPEGQAAESLLVPPTAGT